MTLWIYKISKDSLNLKIKIKKPFKTHSPAQYSQTLLFVKIANYLKNK